MAHPNRLGSQDTFHVRGILKGVRRIYQQSFGGPLCEGLHCEDGDHPAADLLKDWVLPFFEQQAQFDRRIIG